MLRFTLTSFWRIAPSPVPRRTRDIFGKTALQLQAACLFLLACVGAAPAGAPFDGRWTADEKDCVDDWLTGSPVTVAPLSIAWPGMLCAVRTSYLVRDVWHISARCWSDFAVSNVPIRLEKRGDRLLLHWGHARPEELRRCP